MADIHPLELAAAEWTAELLAAGYCVIPELLPADAIAGLDRDLASDFDRTPFCQGGFYGARTKRFGRLLLRSPGAARLVQHALVTAIVERVLSPWCDTIQLNLTQAIALHPGALPQVPHRDQDMWRGELGKVEYLVNVTCLEHAPPPLTANGLDMRVGHPAADGSRSGSQGGSHASRRNPMRRTLRISRAGANASEESHARARRATTRERPIGEPQATFGSWRYKKQIICLSIASAVAGTALALMALLVPRDAAIAASLARAADLAAGNGSRRGRSGRGAGIEGRRTDGQCHRCEQDSCDLHDD